MSKITDTDLFNQVVPEDPLQIKSEEREKAPRPKHSPRMIKIDSIVRRAKGQTRQVIFDPNNDQKDLELAISIKEKGIIQPLGVKQISGGLAKGSEYELVWGERRLEAAIYNKLEYVLALIVKTDENLAELTLTENLGRKDLTPYELAEALVFLLDGDPDLSTADLVRKTGVPQSTAYQLVDAYKSPEVIKSLFRDGISPRAVKDLKTVFQKTPDENWGELANIIKNNSFSSEDAGTLKAQVEAGTASLTAATFLANIKKQVAGEQIDPSATKTKRSKTKKSASKQTPLDEGALKVFAQISGMNISKVKNLAREAEGQGLTGDGLLAVCLYISKGGEEQGAIALAKQLDSARRIRTVVLKYLKLTQNARGVLLDASENHREVAAFAASLLGIPHD